MGLPYQYFGQLRRDLKSRSTLIVDTRKARPDHQEMRLFASFAFLLSMTVTPLFAQTKTYQSALDGSLNLQKILVLPMVDNVKSIYAKPLSERLIESLSQDRRFEVIKGESPKMAPEDFETNPKAVAALLASKKADSLLTSRLIKGTKGLTIRLTLIAGTEQLPMAQEVLEDYQGFETNEVKMQMDQLLAKLFSRLPYQAVVTSRQGQVVTLNAGSRHGLKLNDEIFVVLITGVERHPKLKFITKVDREIMGKVRLAKVDESVSFGSLVSERTANLIKTGFKATWSDPVFYPTTGITENGGLIPQLGDRPEAPIAYGDSPREWTTGKDASFGKVALLAGLAQTNLSTALSTGASPTSGNLFSPLVRIDGQMWLDPNWQFDLVIEQLATKIPNELAGSAPGSLNMQMQELTLLVAYNFLVSPEQFWGPKFQLMGGFSKYSIFVDDTNPRSHTSKDYGGFAFGLGGSFPVLTETMTRLLLGGKFLYYWQPTLSESPISSGSAANQITHFNLFLEYGLTDRMAFRTDINFKQASSSFSGGSSTSASANIVNLMAGGAFYF